MYIVERALTLYVIKNGYYKFERKSGGDPVLRNGEHYVSKARHTLMSKTFEPWLVCGGCAV